MTEREKKVLELQAEIDFLNYISDFAERYKNYDIEYHAKRLEDSDISDYDKEYNATELAKDTYQKEYIKKFISKI